MRSQRKKNLTMGNLSSHPVPLAFWLHAFPPAAGVTLCLYSFLCYNGFSVQFWTLPLPAMIFLIVRY